MSERKPRIILQGLQIKSLDKAKKLAAALNTIEEECGIREVEIIFKDIFVCAWIKMDDLKETEMECLIRDLLKDNTIKR